MAVTKVVIVGKGGREHALAQVLGQVAEVEVTPGNPGIPNSTPTPAEHLEADLFVIGPEDQLAKGLADALRFQGKLVVGPGGEGARLESSKNWMRYVLGEAGVPIAAGRTFGGSERAEAETYLASLQRPFVVKTDGLAGGKGVLVTRGREQARRDLVDKLRRGPVIVEEFVDGPELSVTAVCSNRRIQLLPESRDHKRLRTGGFGPNTGGMGAFSPVPDALPEGEQLGLVEDIAVALSNRDIDYRGILYVGLKLSPDGPKVLECNVRFGDPEAQAILPRLEPHSLLAALQQVAAGQPVDPVEVLDVATVSIALTTQGYPDKPKIGSLIKGLEEVSDWPGVQVQYGAVSGRPGEFRTAGGRVLYVTATTVSPTSARELANEAAKRIGWPGRYYRRDIGG